MTTTQLRAPYGGTETSLVIAIDIGTTYSGASYTILVPDQIPRVYSVTGFKGQEDQFSSTKVPSVLYYDYDGELLACGSEGTEQFADDDENCIKVEWFKLLLRPRNSNLDLRSAPRANLPPNKTIVDIFGDFLAYMKVCVQRDITETHEDGPSLWENYGETARFVLTHPNGWGGYQQAQMREAAIKGGLVPDTNEGKERIDFVSEGEASFHWCVDTGLASSSLFVGSQIIVADCGGGTIDVSSFRVSSLRPLQLEETGPPECRLAGSIFVTRTFRNMIQDKLKLSPFGEEDFIDTAVKDFDKRVKCTFRDRTGPVNITIGTRRDNDSPNNIRLGKLNLTGSFIAQSFERSCTETSEAIRSLLNRGRSSQIFLVGGFAASPWLMAEVAASLSGPAKDIKRAESHTAKAVAHGAVVHFLDHYVSARVPKYSYGTSIAWHYTASDIDHLVRSNKTYISEITGAKMVDGFKTVVKKGKAIRSDSVYTAGFSRPLKDRQAYSFELSLERYSGTVSNITFYDMDDASCFKSICKFKGEIPAKAVVWKTGPVRSYWAVPYDLVVTLGTAEIKCYVEWKEDGVKKRSLATSVWEDY